METINNRHIIKRNQRKNKENKEWVSENKENKEWVRENKERNKQKNTNTDKQTEKHRVNIILRLCNY